MFLLCELKTTKIAQVSVLCRLLRGLAILVSSRRCISLADQAVVSVANMCTTVMIGRFCARPELGLYASGLSLTLLATAIQGALISVPYTIASPRLTGAVGRVYKGNTFLQQLTLGAVIMLVLFLCSLLTSHSVNSAFAPILLILGVVSGLICLREFARRISYAELHFGLALKIDSIAAGVQVLGIGLLAFNSQLTAVHALAVVGIASGTAGALWVNSNYRSLAISLDESLSDFNRNWSLGRWLLACSILWSISFDQYPWIISSLRMPSEAGTWAACYGVMAFLNPIVLALNNDASPRIANAYARRGLRGLRQTVLHSALIAAIIVLPVFTGLLIFGSRLVTLMYGSKFSGHGQIIALLATGLLLYAAGLAFPYGLLALGRQRLDFLINVACFCFFLTLGTWLVKCFGPLGAALSFMSTHALALSLRVLVFFRVAYVRECGSADMQPAIQTAGKKF